MASCHCAIGQSACGLINGYADNRSIVLLRRKIVFLTKPFTLDQMKAAIGAVFVEARGGG